MLKKPLYLPGVQVHRQDPVGPRRLQEVGHQPAGNWHPGLVFFIGPAVAIVGHHRCYPARRSPLAGIDHDQQFHQVVVYRITGGLNDENVPLPNVFLDSDEGVVVGELEDFSAAQRHFQVFADRFGQLAIGVAAEDLQLIENRVH